MLSRASRLVLSRAFSSSIESSGTASRPLAEELGESAGSFSNLSSQQLVRLEQSYQEQKLHLAYHINDVRAQIRSSIDINFSQQQENETIILETTPGANNWKLAEVLTLGSGAKLLQLLVGFPSYAALVGTLGVAGIGAALSYSNYLRRTSPQITSIHLTAGNKLHIYYLKPEGLLSTSKRDFEVDLKSFSFASFENGVENWLRKSNSTSWVRIDNELFWFNAIQQDLQLNSQLYHKLF